ncbi:hypothetical protein CesoFtcFv8_011632 [Champsocephalus esox]|uniref:Uncharacterized protein n=2 Tax=Champsocephalus TaxID=52236 RepID=A0AAN8HQC4_CHAGU|nr:hypothetical protein CesoFtcFv8_011632 [Champsocephalus esox]KAK5924023.1 hypothetical protein CgunFtcFv8_000939 [Champsocephalus gunnari]
MSEFLEAEQCGSVFEPESTKRGNERETFLQPGPYTVCGSNATPSSTQGYSNSWIKASQCQTELQDIPPPSATYPK